MDPNADVGPVVDELVVTVKQVFSEFLTEFTVQDELELIHPYVQQALEMEDRQALYVDFQHVSDFDNTLADQITLQFYRLMPHLNQAAQSFVDKQLDGRMHVPHVEERAVSVAFHNFPLLSSIRDLKTATIGHLSAISGTVTRTSEVRPELVLATFKCIECQTVIRGVEQQFQYTEPTVCPNAACENRSAWQLDTSESRFVDWQKVRVQENSSEIPAGSMPRSMDVIMRGDIVEKAKPGDKCTFVGTLVVVPDLTQLNKTSATSFRGKGGRSTEYQGVSGLQSMGVRDLTYKLNFLASSVRALHASFGSNIIRDDSEVTVEDFTIAERERILQMKATSDKYRRMVESVAPTVFGHSEIKRGILLMLFGGVHKETKSSTSLRGDINVCIVGDPSTSKSQFLKYVVGFLPRAVYTSGKASSAAGLTASVIKDPETGEFTIEAGALMLADNSICCIDEFDKMDIVDQSAIHEAMEQQTISITKAGIQATLNARTSILAAANPIRGRYDKSRTLKQNIDISAPIMSRFDLFYVVLDECDEVVDYNIARHIVNVHQNRESALAPDFSTSDLQVYIRFARMLKPQITEEARKLFVEKYVQLRNQDASGANRTAYRITVRQLESMVRLAEALARLHLDEFVKPMYVEEAARLLRMSIIHVDAPEVSLEDDDYAGAGAGGGYGDDDDGDDDDDDDGFNDDDDQDMGDGGGGQGVGGSKAHALLDALAAGAGAVEGGADGDASTGGADLAASQQRAGAPEQAVKKKKKKKKVVISFQEYVTITNLIVRHLRKMEEQDKWAVQQKDIVDWWVELQEKTEEHDEESQVRANMQKVTRIIRRLVNVDHVLVVMPPTEPPREDEEVTEGDRWVAVHPNFDPESQTTLNLDLLPEEEQAIKKVLNEEKAEKRKAAEAVSSSVAAEASSSSSSLTFSRRAASPSPVKKKQKKASSKKSGRKKKQAEKDGDVAMGDDDEVDLFARTLQEMAASAIDEGEAGGDTQDDDDDEE